MVLFGLVLRFYKAWTLQFSSDSDHGIVMLMAMMVCGVGAVYLACKLANRSRNGEGGGLGAYLLLGLLAGLGWWSNQLVVAFLLTTALILLMGVSWRMIREGTLPVLCAFFVGSAPFWIWNISHEWGTFDFREALGRLPLHVGLPAFYHTFLTITELESLRF